MIFITAGLGGGTGTGAAPIIASVAKELGILTVAIVTIPFTIEGKKRRAQAEEGLVEIKKYVDTLLVIGNDKLREIYGNLKMGEAFMHADNVLLGAAKAIAEIISINLHINVDFNDVKTVMKDSGVAIMGSASASGENRALRAVENALNSPLLNDNNIHGARHVLLNIMSGSDDITMDEFGEITDFIQEESGYTAELITGYGIDPKLGDQVSVTIIATGFKQKNTGYETVKEQRKIFSHLNDEKNEPSVTSITESTENSTSDSFIVLKQTNEETHSQTVSTELKEISSENNVGSELENIKPEMEFIIHDSSELSANSMPIENESDNPSGIDQEKQERIRLAQERIKKLKELSLRSKTAEGLSELEREPSFRRKNTTIENSDFSSASNVSRFSLTSGDGKTEIKPNNSFLHDNVD
jgi:cell division protein FtsZ